LKIVAISDTHGQHNKLVLPEGDVLVHAGDWSRRGEEIDTINFLMWFDEQDYNHKVFIAGNHCWFTERYPEEFQDLLDEHAPTCIYLQDSGTTIEGIEFWGSPVQPEFFNWAWNRKRGKQIKKHWDLIPDTTQVLITHGPPQGIGDMVTMGMSPNCGQNVGCLDLIETIEQRLHKLKLHIFGHIHTGHGEYEQDGKTFINASVLNDQYMMSYPPIEIDI